MFRNVVVGVDGRPNGRDGVALAARLVDPDGRLSLVHVHSGELHPVHAVTPGLLAEEHDASTAMLERERAAADVEAELVSFVALSPGRGLHQLAEERGADLIVVGSSSRGIFGRAMLSDDTRTALNGAPCAVAVGVRGYAENPGPLATIGVGYNETPESESALALARELAAPTNAVIRVLEVVSIPSYAFTGLMPPAVGDSIEQMLTAANERLQGILGVEGRAVYGITGEELAAFGSELDLLVVGSRSYGPWRRLVMGSTSDFLERHGRCSLIVLPRGWDPHAAAAQAGGEQAHSSGAPEER